MLNRREDGKLQIDYYRNYVGYDEEIHYSYPAPDNTWDRITEIKEQYLLGNSSGIRMPGMCGGYSLVKIREGDSVIRLTTGNMTEETVSDKAEEKTVNETVSKSFILPGLYASAFLQEIINLLYFPAAFHSLIFAVIGYKMII